MSMPTPPGASASNDLVPVFLGQIGGVQMHVCDARTLHAFLENGDRFADWIKGRIEKYEFVENQDFAFASGISEAKRGGHNRKDYVLSLDMAKELSMVENNAKGRQARRYFIDCERRAREIHETPIPQTVPPGLHAIASGLAYKVGAEAHDNALQNLDERILECLRLGHTEAEIAAKLERQPIAKMRLIKTEDLMPIATGINELLLLLNDLMEGHPGFRPKLIP